MGLLTPQLSKQKLANLCTRLATMYEAGISLARCFALLEESQGRDIRRLARSIGQDLERGATLAEAVRARSRMLPSFFVEMIAAGEEAGALATVLRNLADDYEAQVAHRRAFQQAVTYPICVVVSGAVVIPVLRMAALGAAPEQMGLFLARALSAPLSWIALYSAWTHLRPYRQRPSRWTAGFRTRSWVWRTFDLANALRAMAALYASGLSLPRCLERASSISANPRQREALLRAAQAVRGGTPLSEAMASWKGIPPDAAGLIAVGERSGKLDSALDHAAKALRDAASHRLRVGLISLESLLILAIGVAIVAGRI